jgi:adenosylmethionine-8-amino-7-oxononanoate aminotransferase
MSRLLHRTVGSSPIAAVKGEGMMLTLADGSLVIDACGGAAVACLGHGNRRVAEAIGRQAATMAYAHTGFFTSEPAEALADMLVGDQPGGLSHAFFVSSGSEAMEAAIKLARQYFVEIGQPQRDRFISRRQSYHGNTLGALSVSGHAARRQPYEPLLDPRFSRVSPCFPFRYQAPGETDAGYVDRLAKELDAVFQSAGPERVIGFVAETVVGATSGAVAPTPGYFAAVREVCDRYGALLILDEVMCGMGRTGSRHAWEQEGVTPDLQTIGKGLGGGYQPIGGVLAAKRVVEALRRGSGVFVHGQTYQAHPVACAAALEVQRIIDEGDLLANVRRAGAWLGDALRARFGDHPVVIDVRGRGLFWALEFAADRVSRAPMEPALGFAEIVKRKALACGVAIYPGCGTVDGVVGDHLLVAPPYWVEREMIDEIVARLGAAIDRAAASVRRLRGAA